MNKTELKRKAIEEIDKRRFNAEQEAKTRAEKIENEIPEIVEIRRMLTQTAAQLSMDIVRRNKGYESNFEKIKKNSLEGQQMIKNLLRGKGYPEDYLDVQYRCKICNDTGYVDGKPCECLNRLTLRYAAEELNRSANMPLADFNHFNLEYYRGITFEGTDSFIKMKENYSYCLNYAAEFSRESGNILMYGPTGVGKTHLSMAIAKELTAKGFNVIYGSVINILQAVENEHFGRAVKGTDTLSTLFESDLLILDDLGAEHDTPFNEMTLYNIINTRINTGSPFVISTNIMPDTFAERYNERIISRLMCSSKRLLFVGNDIRQLKRMGQ
ncbi:MAG: ATP-binding protein [Oscillospiraceae bacterium]|nr:ATP-binding protein [Oscillospiraceae bacterium]